MSNEIILKGCTPTPLASYLKALGILRLVAEQVDPDAAGRWQGEHFVLRTKLTRQELERFFLEQYQPTPIVAPWGARSGFFKDSSEKKAREALARISSSSLNRLEPYKKIIRLTKDVLKEFGLTEKAVDEEKIKLLRVCRARFPDDLLKWLDACYILTADGRKFPPLLGTGGNEGSGSYVSGFAQQVVSCIIDRECDHGVAAAMFGEVMPNIISKQTPGHFSPTSSGGPNAGSGFHGATHLNPWDYLFCLEGTMLFASSATRKYEYDQPKFNFPFTVSSTGSGAGSYLQADENPDRAKRQTAEMWLPLWERFLGLDELQFLFSEGRSTVGRRAAYDGLDFARAIAGLGVDRGIQAFERYGFLMRFGKSFFAVSLGKKRTRRYRIKEASLLAEIDDWLARLRRFVRGDQASGRMRQLARQLEESIFALTDGNRRDGLQQILIQLGKIERYCAVSKKAQEVVQPVPRLSESWVIAADDGSPEYRIACALAGLYAPGLPMRAHLVPVNPLFIEDASERLQWNSASRLVTWRSGDLVANLIYTIETRLLEAERQKLSDKPLDGFFRTDMNAVLRFLDRKTDDTRISDLMAGLACARLPRELPSNADQNTIPEAAPLVFTLLKPLFVPNNTLRWLKLLSDDISLPLPRPIIRWLSSGQVDRATEEAARRLRIAGFYVPPNMQMKKLASPVSGARLLAALMIPLEMGATARICRQLTIDKVSI